MLAVRGVAILTGQLTDSKFTLFTSVHVQMTSVAAHWHFKTRGTSLKQRVDGSELILKQHVICYLYFVLLISARAYTVELLYNGQIGVVAFVHYLEVSFRP